MKKKSEMPNPEKFKEKYRTDSVRLKNWDYSSDGAYFITICTQDREHFFGNVVDGQMILSEIGQIADKFWKQIPDHFPFVILDEFMVMPNHMHGILFIDKNNDKNVETPKLGVSTGTIKNKNPHHNPQWKSGCLGSTINQYKRICTIHIKTKNLDPNFAWQPRFYDHIIRDEKSLNRIREYIQMNPKNWETDRNNSENLYI